MIMKTTHIKTTVPNTLIQLRLHLHARVSNWGNLTIRNIKEAAISLIMMTELVPMVGIVVTISPSLSLYKMVVLPAASRPTIRMRISFLAKSRLNSFVNVSPIMLSYVRSLLICITFHGLQTNTHCLLYTTEHTKPITATVSHNQTFNDLYRKTTSATGSRKKTNIRNTTGSNKKLTSAPHYNHTKSNIFFHSDRSHSHQKPIHYYHFHMG